MPERQWRWHVYPTKSLCLGLKLLIRPSQNFGPTLCPYFGPSSPGRGLSFFETPGRLESYTPELPLTLLRTHQLPGPYSDLLYIHLDRAPYSMRKDRSILRDPGLPDVY